LLERPSRPRSKGKGKRERKKKVAVGVIYSKVSEQKTMRWGKKGRGVKKKKRRRTANDLFTKKYRRRFPFGGGKRGRRILPASRLEDLVKEIAPREKAQLNYLMA